MDTVPVPAPLVWGLLIPGILALATLAGVALTNKLTKRDVAACQSMRDSCRKELFDRLDDLAERTVRIETKVGVVISTMNNGGAKE